jgi:hypothetical protein
MPTPIPEKENEANESEIPISSEKEGIKGTNNSLEKLQRTFCVNSHLSGLKTPTYNAALTNFFQQYEEYKKSAEKRRKRGRAPLCLSCNQVGGTSFVVQRDAYVMKCDVKKKPCSLYVLIRKGEMTTFNEKLEKLRTKLESIAHEVVLLKYNAAFGYSKPEDSRKHYERLMRIYTQAEVELKTFSLLKDECEYLQTNEKLVVRENEKSVEAATKSVQDDIRQIKRTFLDLEEELAALENPCEKQNRTTLTNKFSVIAEIVERIHKKQTKIDGVNKTMDSTKRAQSQEIWVDETDKTEIC